MQADQFSHTAAFLAIKFYGLTRDERFRSLFDESTIAFYEKLVESLPSPLHYYHFWLRHKWIRRWYIKTEELFLPGDLLHVIARKWYIQQLIDQQIEKECQQLVVIGAGFDHLGLRYSQKGLSCIEIDAPYMSELKRQFLNTFYPGQPKPAITGAFLPVDNLGKLLSNLDGINLHKKTTVVAEGFFDYLSNKVVKKIIDQIQQSFSQQPVLISTHFALDELNRFHRKVFESSVQLVGEKLQLDLSMEEFAKLLSTGGYHITKQYDKHKMNQELQSKIQTNLSVIDGFYILEAQ